MQNATIESGDLLVNTNVNFKVTIFELFRSNLTNFVVGFAISN